MKEVEKAYIAGLIDGEGSICLTRLKKNTRRAPSVSFPNTSLDLISKFKEICGGVCSSKKTTKDNNTPSFHVQIRYDAALTLLRLVRPYMRRPKKCYRADLLLSDYKKVTSRNGKYTEALNKAREDFEYRFFHPPESSNRF